MKKSLLLFVVFCLLFSAMAVSADTCATAPAEPKGPFTVTYEANNGLAAVPCDGAEYMAGDAVTVLFDPVQYKDNLLFYGWDWDNDGIPDFGYEYNNFKMPEKNVRIDVQSMINKGFFDKPGKGISAYINGEYDQIVMTKYGVPMQPIKKPREADNVPANSYIAKLRDEMDRTTDEELLETLRTMESSIKRIEAKIEEEPKLKDMSNIRKLKETYLPQTLDLIKKFNDGEGSDEMRWEIKAMLGTCAKAFKNIETKVYEREDIDTKVDMEVLRKTLEREGLLGSDFNIQS